MIAGHVIFIFIAAIIIHLTNNFFSLLKSNLKVPLNINISLGADKTKTQNQWRINDLLHYFERIPMNIIPKDIQIKYCFHSNIIMKI